MKHIFKEKCLKCGIKIDLNKEKYISSVHPCGYYHLKCFRKIRDEKGIYCNVCGDLICKYDMDFSSSGAISLDVGKDEEIKDIDVCFDCAKEISKEFIDNQ